MPIQLANRQVFDSILSVRKRIVELYALFRTVLGGGAQSIGIIDTKIYSQSCNFEL
ncbi:hypothetical protein L0152_04325 [bacterium]|nr:hypothetical protein [bacterium]